MHRIQIYRGVYGLNKTSCIYRYIRRFNICTMIPGTVNAFSFHVGQTCFCSDSWENSADLSESQIFSQHVISFSFFFSLIPQFLTAHWNDNRSRSIPKPGSDREEQCRPISFYEREKTRHMSRKKEECRSAAGKLAGGPDQKGSVFPFGGWSISHARSVGVESRPAAANSAASPVGQ